MAYENGEAAKISIWRMLGEAIVVLKIPTLESLEEHADRASMAGIQVSKIYQNDTLTVCGIGPDSIPKINAITGSLKLL
jgi:peptidyl-tRNA hydrolase